MAARRAKIDECMLGFRAEQRYNSERWNAMQQVPRRLYHYTTLEGLVEITSSSIMWASDARFLNDASELKYAADLIDEVIVGVFEEVKDEELRALLPDVSGFANAFEYGVQPFVACFCEDGDLLSQWRAYGHGEAPAALGLDFSIMASAGLPSRTYLRKVIYDEAEQRQHVADVVRTWISTADSMIRTQGMSREDLFPYPATWSLQEALSEHHLCFKAPAFSEEHEWRLIKLVNVREELGLLSDQRLHAMMAAVRQRTRELGIDIPEHDLRLPRRDAEGVEIKFRESSRGLIPYVELKLVDTAGPFMGRLPLWEVVQGPAAVPELALESLNMYLDRHGYGFHTDIRASGIPLRP